MLFEGKDVHGRPKPLLGTLREGAKTWHDPVTEDPLLGAVEAWDVYNTTGDTHPVHVHLVHFRVVGHRRFEGEPNDSGVLGKIRWIDDDRPPGADARGPKDTAAFHPARARAWSRASTGPAGSSGTATSSRASGGAIARSRPEQVRRGSKAYSGRRIEALAVSTSPAPG